MDLPQFSSEEQNDSSQEQVPYTDMQEMLPVEFNMNEESKQNMIIDLNCSIHLNQKIISYCNTHELFYCNNCYHAEKINGIHYVDKIDEFVTKLDRMQFTFHKLVISIDGLFRILKVMEKQLNQPVLTEEKEQTLKTFQKETENLQHGIQIFFKQPSLSLRFSFSEVYKKIKEFIPIIIEIQTSNEKHTQGINVLRGKIMDFTNRILIYTVPILNIQEEYFYIRQQFDQMSLFDSNLLILDLQSSAFLLIKLTLKLLDQFPQYYRKFYESLNRLLPEIIILNNQINDILQIKQLEAYDLLAIFMIIYTKGEEYPMLFDKAIETANLSREKICEASIYYYYGKHFIKKKKIAEAKQQLIKCLEIRTEVLEIHNITRMLVCYRLKFIEIIDSIKNSNDIILLINEILKKVGNTYEDIICLQSVGEMFNVLDQYQAAIFVYQNCLIKQQSKEDLDLAITYYELGRNFESAERHQKAILAYEESLRIRKSLLPQDNLEIAQCYSNIGYSLESLNKSKEAIKSFKLALNIRLTKLPADHLDISKSYNNIGVSLDSLEKYQEAISSYQKCLAIRNKKLPENHSDIAKIYYNIGFSQDNNDDYEGAIESYRKSLTIQLKKLPPDDLEIAKTYNNLGVSLLNMDRYSEAFDAFQSSIEIRLKSQPADHLDIGRMHSNIANSLVYQEKLYQAFQHYRSSLQIRTKRLPSSHILIANTTKTYATCIQKFGKYQEAIISFKKSLLMCRNQEVNTYHQLATLNKTSIKECGFGINKYSLNKF